MSVPAHESAKPVAFVGDSHLLAGDDTTAALVTLLEAAPSRFSRLVLVGDIFDLWLARPHLHEEHHRRLLAALDALAEGSFPVDYVVGNRDYGVETLPESPFDRCATETLQAPGEGSVPWLAEHGDLINESDKQYRAWRAFSRSAPVLGLALALPARLGVPASQWLERRMRTTNLMHKRDFPTEHAVARACSLFSETGARHLVLGHFHEELVFDAGEGQVHVLPDWGRARRHAEWTPSPTDPGGVIEFCDS